MGLKPLKHVKIMSNPIKFQLVPKFQHVFTMAKAWQRFCPKLLFRLCGVALGVVDVNLGSEKPFRHVSNGEEMVISWD